MSFHELQAKEICMRSTILICLAIKLKESDRVQQHHSGNVAIFQVCYPKRCGDPQKKKNSKILEGKLSSLLRLLDQICKRWIMSLGGFGNVQRITVVWNTLQKD